MNLLKQLKRGYNFLIWLVQETFTSKRVDRIYDELAPKKYEFTIDYPDRVKSIHHVFSSLHRNFREILDLACGTGASIEAMPWKKSAHILGLDISPQMLTIAKNRFKNYPNIELRNKSFLDLSFKEDTFDLITMTYASRFVPQINEIKFAANTSRILKSNGLLIIITAEDTFSSKPIRWISHHLLRRKSANMQMVYSDYITKLFQPYLSLYKQIIFKKNLFFIHHTALIFKK